MSEITIKNIKYTNVPNKKVGAKVANKLTQSNIGMSQTVAAYLASESFYKLINAIDIDWNGIEIDANTHINDTSDLITWIATKAGQAGANGVTPHIGQNGNWFIGDTDTNVKAEGTKGDKGDDGTPGTNGKSAYELYVDGVPSGETAMTQVEWLASLKGAKGDKGDTGTVDTTNFYTKAEVDQKVANAASGGNVDLSGYAQTSDLATVATTGDYDDLTNKPTIPTVPTKTSDLTNDSGFLTSHQSLSNYYTKDQVDSFNFITEYGLSQLVYGKDESDAKYLTSHQSLANYYTKNDIDGFMFVTGADLSQNVYTKTEVDNLVGTPFVANDYYTKNQIDSFNFVNEYGLSQLVYGKEDVYTKNQIDNMGFLTSHQSLANYYDKDDIDGFSFITGSDLSDLVYGKNDVYTKNQIDNMGFITSHQSLSNYYDKDDIDAFHFVTEGNLQSWVYTKTEVNNKIGNLGTVTETVDNEEVTRSKTVKEYVDGNLPNMNNYYTKNDIDGFSFVTGSNLGTLVYGKSDVYTKTEIDNKVGNLGTVTETVDNEEVTRPKTIKEYVDGNTPNMINYYTKTEIDNFNFVTGSNLYQNVYSKTDSDNRYLREHQSLSNYYTKAEADAAIARMQASAGDNSGGFKIATNSSNSETKGLYNSTVAVTTNAKNTIGHGAVIEGYGTASGNYSHAEGYGTTSSGSYSHAEGSSTTASGWQAHAEGSTTTASGSSSHAEGHHTTASGNYSHAEGYYTNATNLGETAIGCFNASSSFNSSSIQWNDGSSSNNMTANLFSVGNGNAENKRHNALRVDRDGRVYIADTDKVGEPSYILDGTQYYYDYANVPMISLQGKFASIDTSLSNLNNNKPSTSEVQTIINEQLAEFQEAGGQVQPDWAYNNSYSAFNYIKNKPVGFFHTTLVKEFTNVIMSKSNYNDNSYYYTPFHIAANYSSSTPKYIYPSTTSEYLLVDENDEILNEAPSWLDSDTRYIIEVDGKRVLCNSANEGNEGRRGCYSAEGYIEKVTCTINSNGDEIEPTDIYYIHITFPEWLTQTPNVSSLKLYRIDSEGSTNMYCTWYDINHVYFYDKEEINNLFAPSDWEETDPNSKQYIVNKPFGDYKVTKRVLTSGGNYLYVANNMSTSTAGHLYGGGSSLSGYGLAPGDKFMLFVNGKYYATYNVVLKNDSYACTENYDTNSHQTSDDTELEWSFYSYYYGTRQTYLYVTWKDIKDKYTNQSVGLKWYYDNIFEFYFLDSNGNKIKTVKIDNKYLDLSSYFNDENVPASDKPFGEYKQEHVSYEVGTLYYDNSALTFTQTGPSHGGASNLAFSEALSVGDEITLEVDGEILGTAEVYTAASYNNRIEVGEGARDSYGFLNKWMILSQSNSYVLAIFGMTSGTHSVKVYMPTKVLTYTDEIKKLDAKYVDYNSYVTDPTIPSEYKAFGDYNTDTISTIYDYSKVIPTSSNDNIQIYDLSLTFAESVELANKLLIGGYIDLYIDDEFVEKVTPYVEIAVPNGGTSNAGNISAYSHETINNGGYTYSAWKFYRTGYNPNTEVTHYNLEFENLNAIESTIFSKYFDGNSHKFTLKCADYEVLTKKLDSKYVDLSNYYTKAEANAAFSGGGGGNSPDMSNYYTKTEVSTTYATKAELPSIWTGTQAQYDALQTKDSSTIYLIK